MAQLLQDIYLKKMPKIYKGRKYASRRRAVRRAAYGRRNLSYRSSGRANYSAVAMRGQKNPFTRVGGNQIAFQSPILGNSTGVPEALFTTHRYCENFSLYSNNTTGLTGSEMAFRLGSLYDPNFTSSTLPSHQVRGFDQMSTLYNRYLVYAVTINVTVIGSGTTASDLDGFVVGNIRPWGSGYSLPNKYMWEVAENPNCFVLRGSRSGGDKGELSWQQKVYLADIEGKPRSQYWNDISYHGSASTDPSVTPYLSLAVGSASTSVSQEMKILVQLEYHCKWFVRTQVTYS